MPPRALVLAAVWLTAACASRSPAVRPMPAPARSPARCLVLGDSAGPPRPTSLLFDDRADAANTGQATDRLAPLRLDCEGRVAPGLAEAWSRDSTGRFWTFTLRPPRDTAGAVPRWTAATLAATWRADSAAATELRRAGVLSIVPLDERRLVVGFAAPSLQLPLVFADRTLAVGVGAPVELEVSVATGDLRDGVDGDADVIVTTDPAVLDYAARHPLLRQAALPWSRRYLLIMPRPVPGLLPSDTSGFRAALARDAVRADAKAVPEAERLDSTAPCLRVAARAALSGVDSLADAVVYSADDATARELAERVVALASGAPIQARSLEPAVFGVALTRAAAGAFVVRTRVRTLSACSAPRTWPVEAAVVPLIDVRAHAIVRSGTMPLMVEWDGALRTAEPADTLVPSP